MTSRNDDAAAGRAAGATAGAVVRPKLNYAQTFSIGFGFLAISAAWALYNAYVSIKLKGLMLPTAVVGMIMGIDNFCGFTIQPLFGILSDKVRTRWGRRLPFALFSIPLGALCLILISVAPNVPLTVTAIVIYAVVMATSRAPIVALMPDVTDSRLRSRANGIINFMGSIGNVLALAGGSLLYKRFGMSAAFVAGAVIMVAAVTALMRLVREPAEFVTAPGERARLPFVSWREFREAVVPRLGLDGEARRSFMLILIVLFLYTMGGNAVETYFTLYATHDLGMDAATAGGDLVWYAVGMLAFAIPAGMIGSRFGRRATMSAGLVLSAALFVSMPWVGRPFMVPILALTYGVFWILVVVNALPWITQLGGVEHTGAMTAYYYLATSFGAAISPTIFGLIQQALGEYRWMFIYAVVLFACALACMPFITRGEAEDVSADAD